MTNPLARLGGHIAALSGYGVAECRYRGEDVGRWLDGYVSALRAIERREVAFEPFLGPHTIRDNATWLPVEQRFLALTWPTMDRELIEKALRRSPLSIRVKASRLKVGRASRAKKPATEISP